MKPHPCHLAIALAAVCLGGPARGQWPSSAPGEVSVRSYPSIHEAIRANPGRVLYVPSGDYPISEPLSFSTDGSGLVGPGRIVQTDPKRAIIRVEKAAGVRLRDLTLTRPKDRAE